jgi:sugar lactone lactonase YvrE
VLAAGAALHGANGMMFDRHDRLHIASVAGREIVVMDPQSGAVLDRLGPDRGVEGPDDLTFGPDGALYWTSFFTGAVARRAPDGTVSTIAQLPPGAGAITFSDDGRLFVAVSTLGTEALYELDPNGANPPRLIAQGLDGLNAMDWGADGLLYGPLSFAGQVVRINVDSGAITKLAKGFGLPTAAKFDSRGRLYVVDQRSLKGHGEVVRVELGSGRKTVIARLAAGLDNLAFDAQDRLFVSSFHDGFVAEVEPDGGEVRMVSAGGMISPGGVAALPRGREGESVFVADLFSLRELDAQTGQQRSVERGIAGFSQLLSPVFTVAPDGDRLLVSSWFGNAVQLWDPTAQAPVATYDGFAGPLNAIRFQGDLVVAEQGGSVVRAQGANPAERATLAAGLGVPAGLAATDDDLWVGEWATGRVLQLVADGQPLAPPRVVAAGLATPEGLAVTSDHNSLLVVESSAGRLVRIELATGRVSTVAEGLALGAQGIPGLLPTWSFNGVAVGRSGAVYVSGDRANVLYRLD